MEICLYTHTKTNQAVYFFLEAESFSRKTIYGSRKIIALDKDGNECKKVRLSFDGTQTFPSGGIGYEKLCNDGSIYENKDSEKLEAAQKENHHFKLGEHKYFFSKVETDFQLNQFFEKEIEKLYVLEGINSQELIQYVSSDFFEISLNQFRKGYLFARKGKLFLEVAKDMTSYNANLDFIKRENLDFTPDSELTLDDIDFGMN